MAPAPFALDPTIAALADFAASLGPPPVVHVYIVAPGVVAFAMDPRFVQSAAAMFVIMMAMTIARLAAQPTEASARGARHLAYSEGVARAPKRSTAADRRAAECRAWGFQS